MTTKLLPDERLAEALAIERWQGADAPVYVADRIGALALAGDVAGVKRFKAIAAWLDQLRFGREGRA
jgi:hypothetical protein